MWVIEPNSLQTTQSIFIPKIANLSILNESKCLTAADSLYTFTHGEGKALGTFFHQMIPNTLFNHQELA